MKLKISRLRLEMTGVYLTGSSSPLPPPLKAETGVPRKSCDFLGQGVLHLPQFGRGAPRGGRLSGQYSSHNRLSLWPLHRRLQDRCIAVR
ncbi:MAG TPA: hypothetical protein VKV29_14145 [Chthonomonas sp.]|uniref:hypothetical protein n=1 Tax=Chthonomonas sp. TaxID=2282153 RepID=UPI002B4B456B|nr:hypothetical protein [Chthonomonas sp.]HLH81409.1 hypothetical protein [Chthonomonas sp.]